MNRPIEQNMYPDLRISPKKADNMNKRKALSIICLRFLGFCLMAGKMQQG